MNDGMTAALAALPPELQRAARGLWERAGQVTGEVTETLTASFRLLRASCGDPESLSTAARLLSTEVVSPIDAARDRIDATYPDAVAAWQGSGGEAFGRYLPRLSDALESVRDSAGHVVTAITTFRQSVDGLCATVVERTDRAEAAVAAVVSANRLHPFEAVAPVIDVVEEYATYVEELTTTLLGLTGDSHAAGRELALAADVPRGLTATAGRLRLPEMTVDFEAETFAPAHSQISVDTAAMAGLTASLSDNGDHFERAERSVGLAAEHLTPDSFGLAGAYFCDDVHAVLDRDRQLYAAVCGQLDELAAGLRFAAVGYTTADDEAAAELRRGLGDATG